MIKFQFEVPFYIERDSDEIELLVRGNVSAYRRAITNRLPENCSPDEGGEPEIVEVVTNTGSPWDGELSDTETKDAEDKLRLAAQDSEPDEPDEPDNYY